MSLKSFIIITYSGASSWSYAEQDLLVYKPLVITKSLMLS